MTLEELYRVNRDLYVKKYTMKTGSVDDAEDIIQEAFTQALEYFKRGGEVYNELSAWFSSVLYNCWRQYMREKQNQGLVKEDVQILEDIPSNRFLQEDMTLVQKLLSTKNGNRYEILNLHYNLGYLPREILYFVELPIGTIYTYIKDFRKEVEEMFN